MRCYGWSPEFCETGISAAQSQIYYNWAREREMTMFGQLEERKSPGYVQQEMKRIEDGRQG